MTNKKEYISFDGDIEELFSLMNENGKVDDDKLMDWLSSSTSLKTSKKGRSAITKTVRKYKINKLKTRS